VPFTEGNYGRIRPFLYHLTARENLDRIKASRRLDSACTLAVAAGEEQKTETRRTETVALRTRSDEVLLRDQAPLHAGSIEFEGGWDLDRLVHELNRRVFFWAGRENCMGKYGKNHFRRYESERPAILRVRFDDLMSSNDGLEPHFCKYNSGAPRCSNGSKSPRGPRTFLPAGSCSYTSSEVVEVTFVSSVNLPGSTEISYHPVGPWDHLLTGS
jgi:hypothetical protein